MYSALYSIYKKNIFTLAKTLVIKSNYIAEAINNRLRLEGYEVDNLNPQSWRYYKNLAGDYHLSDLPKIRITSVDTLEEIEFTKENMLIHTATAREYAYGSDYYRQLVALHPTKERLILGILNPIDIQKAISAKEAEILFFDSSLVEENETNLIPELQKIIYRFWERWLVPDYRYTHGLYIGANLAVLHKVTVEAIAAIRQDNCKTDYVHSFHIKMYLASHGRLDRFLDALTPKQALFLYRNINYLEANAGKRETFDLLVQRLLTERSYPLAAYDIYQNTAELPNQIQPSIELVQTPLNSRRAFGSSLSFTTDDVLTKQIPMARDNARLQDYYRVDIEERAKLGAYGTYATSVLESSIDDDTNNSIRSLEELLLNHWMYLSSHGLYNATVGFTHPKTGERIVLSAKDAFVFWVYCISKAAGFELIDIPSLVCDIVRLPTVPTFATLRAMSSKRYLSNAVINEVLADNPPINNIVSIDGFYDTVERIHQRLRLHYYVWSSEGSKLKHSFLKATSMRLYGSMLCEFYPNTTYSSWMANKGLSVDGLYPDEALTVANEIFDNATGLSLNTRMSLRETHRAIIGLMTQLSSYALHFIPTVNSEDVLRVPCAEVLIGDVVSSATANYNVPPSRFEVLGLTLQPTLESYFNVNGFDDITLSTSTQLQSTVQSINLNMTTTFNNGVYQAPVSTVGVLGVEFFS